MRIPALAIPALMTISTATPVWAQTYNPDYPVSLQIYGREASYIECAYTSLAQCAHRRRAAPRCASSIHTPRPHERPRNEGGIAASTKPPPPHRPRAARFPWRRCWSRRRAAPRSGTQTSLERTAPALLRNRSASAARLVPAGRRTSPITTAPSLASMRGCGSRHPDPCRSPSRRKASGPPPAGCAGRRRRRAPAAGHRRPAPPPGCSWSGNACRGPASSARRASDQTT